MVEAEAVAAAVVAVEEVRVAVVGRLADISCGEALLPNNVGCG